MLLVGIWNVLPRPQDQCRKLGIDVGMHPNSVLSMAASQDRSMDAS